MKIKEIMMREAAKAGLTLDDLTGDSHARRIAWARQDAMRAVRDETAVSLSVIGRMFNRDHSTVSYAIKRSQERAAE